MEFHLKPVPLFICCLYLCRKCRAMSNTTDLFHIVFCTHNRANTIPLAHRDELFRYIWSLLNNKRCRLLRINGMPNHIHIFVDIHPTVALSQLVADIKRESSRWMKSCGLYPNFDKWAKEYFATSKSVADKITVIEYIKNQEKHHMRVPFEDEIREMFAENNWEWNEFALG